MSFNKLIVADALSCVLLRTVEQWCGHVCPELKSMRVIMQNTVYVNCVELFALHKKKLLFISIALITWLFVSKSLSDIALL